MIIKLDIRNLENVGQLDDKKLEHITGILEALVTTGALTGMKSGKTVIHFDAEGTFQGIELDYWPWKRRTKERA